MTNNHWNRNHILSLADFEPAEYDMVLQTAASFREVLSRRTKKVPTLQGNVVANLFFEPSTRIRSSFELAAKRLSADTLNFSPGISSLSKGETILDTAKTYLAMGADMMVIRHREAGVPQMIASEMDRLGVKLSILNAGDGQHEHPSQGLLDLFTICSLFDFDNPYIKLLGDKKIVIVGDILHSRVARSNIWSLTATGAEVHLVAPPTLLPRLFVDFVGNQQPIKGADGEMASILPSIVGPSATRSLTSPQPSPYQGEEAISPKTQQEGNISPKTQEETKEDNSDCGTRSFNRKLFLHWDLEPALQDADFIMTLRLQKERMSANLLPSLREYHQHYGITRDRLKLCKPNVKVLHPGPVNRGVEISSDLMDDPKLSLIAQQVTSGIAVRMALLYLIGSGKF